jgi:hypothetical protein
VIERADPLVYARGKVLTTKFDAEAASVAVVESKATDKEFDEQPI